MVQTLRIVYCVLVLVTFCHASLSPCNVNDEECLVSTANTLYAKLVAGDPSIGVEGEDPAFFEEIDGSLTILKYKFINSTVHGFKDCQITKVRFDTFQTNMKLNLVCPDIRISGNYDLNGRLIILPVQGNGKFSISAYSYNMTIDAGYKVVKNNDGKEHLSIINFKINADPEKGAYFHFQNLFNGQKDLADAVHKFANENSREVCQELQGPLLSAEFKQFIKNANKMLKSMPMDHLFLQ